MSAFRRLMALVRKEMQALLRDPDGRKLLIAPIIMQLVLFPFAANMDVTNVGVVVRNEDGGPHSRAIIAAARSPSAIRSTAPAWMLPWELDLSGAVRAQRHGAQAGLDAMLVDQDALRLSLPAEITRVYVEHLVVAQQLASLQRSVQASGQRVTLLTERMQQGDASEQEVSAARQAQLDAAIAAYRGTVTDALSDVEQSMLLRQATRESLAALAAGLTDAQHQLDVEQARYAAGDSALTRLLQARLSYESSLNDELRARGDALLGYVRLQKSLGGPS